MSQDSDLSKNNKKIGFLIKSISKLKIFFVGRGEGPFINASQHIAEVSVTDSNSRIFFTQIFGTKGKV